VHGRGIRNKGLETEPGEVRIGKKPVVEERIKAKGKCVVTKNEGKEMNLSAW